MLTGVTCRFSCASACLQSASSVKAHPLPTSMALPPPVCDISMLESTGGHPTASGAAHTSCAREEHASQKGEPRPALDSSKQETQAGPWQQAMQRFLAALVEEAAASSQGGRLGEVETAQVGSGCAQPGCARVRIELGCVAPVIHPELRALIVCEEQTPRQVLCAATKSRQLGMTHLLCFTLCARTASRMSRHIDAAQCHCILDQCCLTLTAVPPQVALAALQCPLMSDATAARELLPRLCAAILAAAPRSREVGSGCVSCLSCCIVWSADSSTRCQ